MERIDPGADRGAQRGVERGDPGGVARGAGGGRRVGPLAVLVAVGRELAGVAATVRRTSLATWLGFALLMGAAAVVGALPLGWLALALQVVGFALVALMVVWPEAFARSMRTDDAFEVRERDSAAVVTYLPVAVAVFALPIYLLAQATLFWRLMRQVPGVLAGSGWGDAWRLSVDNLLFTELFLDAFDLFGVGLAAEPPGLAGRVLVFATRLVLTVGFVRIALSLVRAAYYRAHGLGRGADVLAELRSAAEQGDAVLVGHLGRQVRDDATGTIDVLVARLERSDASREERRDAYRCLRALRDWAIPYFDWCILHGDPRAPALERLVAELRDAWEAPALERPRPRPALAAVLASAALAVAALVVWGPATLAFAIAAVSMLTLLWLLASPRAAYEAAMERGLAPFVPLQRLRGAILGTSALAAVAFLLASWATLWHASALWPGSFEAPGARVDARSLWAFIGASLVRVQASLSLPDVFGFAVPAVEQRPWVGSLLTFVLRTGLNLGFVAVVVTTLQVRRDAQGFAGLVRGSDELAMRVEAHRGGRYAFPLVEHHGRAVRAALWSVLDAAEHHEVQEALAASGAFEWAVPYDSLEKPTTAERMRSQSVVLEVARRLGWFQRTWIAELDAALASAPWPAPVRVQALARRAVVAVRDLDPRRAGALLVEARDLLPAEPTPDEAAGFEATAVWALSVARSVAATRAAAAQDLLPLMPRATEALEHLARQAPERFAVDALRFRIVRAVALGAAGAPQEAAALLGEAADAVSMLPRHHPWRETVLIQAIVAASALAAVATGAEASSEVATDIEARLLVALGPDAARWRVEDLAVRAYDEQLGEELAHSVMAVSHLPASEAQLTTTRRAAAVFEARFGTGVLVARSYAVLLWWFAATCAHALRAHAAVLEATDAVVRLAAGLRADWETERMIADAHAVRAQALRALGDEASAFGHAGTARATYARIGASDWEGAPAVVAQGAAYLQGFDPATS